MILAFDIGNTHIVTAIFNDKGDLLLTFRIASDSNMTEDQLYSYIKNISEFNNVDLVDINGIIVSSVVPSLITTVEWLSEKFFNIKPLIVGLDLDLPFDFSKNLDISGFGADRLINMVRACKLYPEKDIITIDFGTATTYEVLENSTYVGGGILPGINMSINALFGNTAKLPKVKFAKPSTVLGRNTVEQIQAGIFFGYVGQIKEIIRTIKANNPNKDYYIITTGGLGKIISEELCINEYINDLAVMGLFDLYQLNR